MQGTDRIRWLCKGQDGVSWTCRRKETEGKEKLMLCGAACRKGTEKRYES